jgi:hypothetical protein
MQLDHPNVQTSAVADQREVSSCGHAWFLEKLPEIRCRATAYFRYLNADQREDAVADVVAAVFKSCLSAAGRGTLRNITPCCAVTFAVRQFRSGRRFGGFSSTDVMGEGTRAKGRATLQSLYEPPLRAIVSERQKFRRGKETMPLSEVLSDRREQDPAERARQSLDYPQILRVERVSWKARKVFRLLSSVRIVGCGLRIAQELRVSPARICHLKSQLAVALRKHDYEPPGQRRLRFNSPDDTGTEAAARTAVRSVAVH